MALFSGKALAPGYVDRRRLQQPAQETPRLENVHVGNDQLKGHLDVAVPRNADTMNIVGTQDTHDVENYDE